METTREKKFFTRKKVCRFCTESAEIDYKNTDMLLQFITERRKILPRRTTGLCAYHQRQLASAIKRARVMALISFTVLH